MSITRLQQARQMYATGQRVGRVAFGGGGSQDHHGGQYQGAGASKSSSKSSQSNSPGHPGSSYNNPGPSKNDGPSPYHGGGADVIPVTPVTPTFPNNLSGGITVSTNPLDLKEQYRLGNIPTKTGVVTFNNPYVSNALETQRKNNTIDALNLAGSTYKPVNLPSWVPGSTLINTAGNFIGGMGHGVNTKFFAENVAGKYGYGYGLEDYKQYMKDRMSGKVGAYGNVEQGQNAINARGGDGGGGIMDIYNTVNDTDTDTDTDTETMDDFVWRFAGNQPEDVVERIEEEYKDYYTV